MPKQRKHVGVLRRCQSNVKGAFGGQGNLLKKIHALLLFEACDGRRTARYSLLVRAAESIKR
jgi:hypothetical protein